MRKFIFSVLIFVLCLAGIFAQTRSLTLNEALALALENNLSVKRERISLEVAKRSADHAWNSILPSVSLSANDDIELPEFTNNFSLEGKLSLSVGTDFFAAIKKAKLDYETKQISFDEALCEITSQVKELYFSLLLAKENLDFLKENIENARSQAEQNEERYRRGTLSEMEYLSSKLSYEKMKPELKSQELAYKNDLKSFCLFLGIDSEEVFLNGNLEDFISQYAIFFDEEKKIELEEIVKNEEVPSVLNLKKQVESARKDVSAARLTAYGPSALLSYSVTPSKQAASVGLSLPLENLLPFSKGADSINAAKDSVKDLELQLMEKTKLSKAEFSYINESLQQKEESINSLKDSVKLAQANYDATRFAYSKGMTEFLSMQNAAKENLEAKLSLQNDILEKLKLYISLEKLCGISAFNSEEK